MRKYILIFFGFSFALSGNAQNINNHIASIFPNEPIYKNGLAYVLPGKIQRVLKSDLAALGDPKRRPGPKESRLIKSKAILAQALRQYAEQNHILIKIPGYRVDYILEAIFETYLGKRQDYAKLTLVSSYALLREYFKENKDFMPLFFVSWKWQLKNSRGALMSRMVAASGKDWNPFALSLLNLPQSFEDFKVKVRTRLTLEYNQRVLALALQNVMAPKNRIEEFNLQNVGPREQLDWYNKNKNELRYHQTDFKVATIQFPTLDEEALQKRKISFFKKWEKNLKNCSQSFKNLGLKKWMEIRESCFDRSLEGALQDSVVTVETLKWPFQNKALKKKQKIMRHFAMTAPLHNEFLPNRNYRDKEGRLNILFLISEKRNQIITPSYQDLEVRKSIKQRIVSARMLGHLRSKIEKFLKWRVSYADPGMTEEVLLNSLFEKPEKGIYSLIQFDKDRLLPPKKNKFKLIKDEDKVVYRFPYLYNPNPFAGRLYLQPLGPHEDQVIQGWILDFNISTSSEYNRYFHDSTTVKKWDFDRDGVNPDLLYMNSRTLQFKISKGFKIKGFKFEAGALIRTAQDVDNSEMKVFLLEFHNLIDSPGHIPSVDQPYKGAIRKTAVVAPDGRIMITNADLYGKLQLISPGKVKFIDNLSVKLSLRLPFSGQEFDTFGAGLSLGGSKKLNSWLSLLASASLTYQNLSSSDFDTDQLNIEKWAYDFFLGAVVDPGKEGGFYVSLGLRYSSKRVWFLANPDSSAGSKVIHISLHHLSDNKKWEFFLSLGEEIPGFEDSALEPDFMVTIGYVYYFRPKKKLSIDKREA